MFHQPFVHSNYEDAPFEDSGFSYLFYFISLGVIYAVGLGSGAIAIHFNIITALLLLLPLLLILLKAFFLTRLQISPFYLSLAIIESTFTALLVIEIGFGTLSALVICFYIIHVILQIRKTYWLSSSIFFMFALVLGMTLLGEPHYQLKEQVSMNIFSVLILVIFIILNLLGLNNKIELKQQEAESYKDKYYRQLDISAKLTCYLPNQIATQLMNGGSITLDNRRRMLSIFFSDIAGFTNLSERLSSEELSHLLNQYMEEMTAIAKRFGGTIDKFIGDAMVVFFGDPHTDGIEQDAIRCVDMAIAMRRRIEVLRQEWHRNGWEGLNVRMGISTGYAHVGNFGHKSRLNYTIIGTQANLAARLQSVAPIGQILIPRATFDLVKYHFKCDIKPDLQLKGIPQPVENWQVDDRIDHTQQLNRTWLGYDKHGLFLQLDTSELTTIDKREFVEVLRNGLRMIENTLPVKEDKSPNDFDYF